MFSMGIDRTSIVDRRRFRRFLLCVLAAGAAVLSAVCWQIQGQEFDTVISSHNREAYTVADQIEDPQERRALTALFAPTVALEKARLAEAFLTRFPRSWFLPQ